MAQPKTETITHFSITIPTGVKISYYNILSYQFLIVTALYYQFDDNNKLLATSVLFHFVIFKVDVFDFQDGNSSSTAYFLYLQQAEYVFGSACLSVNYSFCERG